MKYLDNDLYCWLMSQVIWNNWPDLEVQFDWQNGSKINPLDFWTIDEIKLFLDQAVRAGPTIEDKKYLESLNCFDKNYLNSLSFFKRPEVICYVDKDNELHISCKGNWFEALFAEVPILYTMEKLLQLNPAFPGPMFDIGVTRLEQKIEFFNQHPELHWFDFGTRRRCNFEWHEYVLKRMCTESTIGGTSNLLLAQQFGLAARGTMAHQMFMVLSAIYGPELAQQKVLRCWESQYADVWDGKLLAMLPDTISTKFFLGNCSSLDLDKWFSMRQDSGNAFDWIELVLKNYKNAGIDATEKLLIFSDKLVPGKALEIHQYVNARAMTAFGIGTNFTNDINIKSVDQRMKPKWTWAAGNKLRCVKYSDDPRKAF